MSDMPEILVDEFQGTPEEFFEYVQEFFKTNEQYRGYDKLIDLIETYELDEYDLYGVTSDGVTAGVAAVRLVDDTLYFDIFTVADGFRGIGVGDKLFNEIVSLNKYANAKNYESMALPGDRSTKNFFEQRKGKARLLIVGGPINRE